MALRRIAGLIRSGWLVFAILLGGHGAYVFHKGILSGGDTVSYSRWADQLIENGYDYVQWSKGRVMRWTRVSFLTLIAALKSISPTGWRVGWIILNLLADAALGVLLVRLVLRLTGNEIPAWFALLWLLVGFEIFQWIPYLLSDTTFLLLTFLMMSVLYSLILDSRPPRRPLWFGLALCMIFSLLYRPTTVVLIPALLVGMWIAARRERFSSVEWTRFCFRGTLVAVIAIGVAVITTALLMQDTDRWPFEPLSTFLGQMASGFQTGEIVHHRPETFHQPPASLLDYVWIILDRFAHFFHVVARGFSWKHNLVSAFYLLPLYAMAAFALVRQWRGQSSTDRQSVVWLSALVVLSFGVFHALTQLDFDWRYRLPAVPHLILLASVGVAELDLLRRKQRHVLPSRASDLAAEP